ncbi:N-6 DNA methylase [Leuconostoc citreum]|uniref:N-6 DNA methylase n=1 Tax=Leuconostoc citreum TaxID=33964 RepID=UPI000BFEC17D|nr:N-6 DNA methylase [Leuconostoc citreum]
MTLSVKEIQELIGCSENYKASDYILEQLVDQEKRHALFSRFLSVEKDLSYDWFTEYFQIVFSDREGKKQDFTPQGLIDIATGIAGDTVSNVDIGGGTGGLVIGRWNSNPEATQYVEEYSDAVIPFLLFNLAIRNMNAVVRHGDSLHQDFKTTYTLTKGEQFSDIDVVTDYQQQLNQSVVMNPPFSMKWEREKTLINDPRFKDFGLAPAGKSDYAFILTGLSKLDDNGTMVAIDSPGILFRGGAEGKIREKLLKANLIDTIISLPEKTFQNTPTGTIILVLKKNRTTQDVLFIDASKEFEKQGKYNVVTTEHVANIIETYNKRQDISKVSHVASLDEIKVNEFNLNLSRYVSTFEPEEEIDLLALHKSITVVDKEISEATELLNDLIGQLISSDKNTAKFLEEVKHAY